MPCARGCAVGHAGEGIADQSGAGGFVRCCLEGGFLGLAEEAELLGGGTGDVAVRESGEKCGQHAVAFVFQLLELAAAEHEMEGDALVEPGFLAGRVLDHEAVAVAVGVRGHEIDIEGEGNGVDEASDAAAEADFGALFADAPEEAFEVIGVLAAEGLRGSPAFERFHCQEAGIDAIGDVVERVSGIVGPVHDLAFDGPEGIAGGAGREFQREVLTTEGPVDPAVLGIVYEVVFRIGEFAEEGFVLEGSVEEGAAWIHPRVLPAEDGFGEHAERLGIPFESAVGFHEAVQGTFSGVAERRVTEVVGEAGGFDEVGVDEMVRGEEGAGAFQFRADAAADLGDLDGVGQSGAVEVVFAGEEDLGFALEPAEGRCMDDAVAVDFEDGAVVAGPRGLGRILQFAVEVVVEAVFHESGSPGSGHGVRDWQGGEP